MSQTVPEPDRERLVWMYRQMLRIREFEERVKATFTEHPGVIRGHTHLADGAEASITGALAALRPGDQVMATYRCHGYPLVLGSDPGAMMAEIYGRATGLCGGYGGSMHLADPERGFLGTSGIVGQGIPQATGAAYAAQIRRQGQVVLCFFGDGASKQGAFAEALNVASLWKLPIVYVLENNSYNVVTRVEQEDANAAAGEPLSVKARAFSMPGVTVNGGDPVPVHGAVAAAVARARSGAGPTLVESKVYRLSAHGNIIAPPGVPLHFPEHEAVAVFGAREEYEAARRADPLARMRDRLVASGALGVAQADEMAASVRDEMAAAVEFALASPYPAADQALRHVYALVRRHEWAGSLPTSRRSTRPSPGRWPGTRPCCTSGRTSPPPRTTSSSGRSARTGSASPRSRRPRRSGWRSGPRWPGTGRWSSCTWPSSCSWPWTRW
jgi:TPP-dependent pyruvate/acetoin dehydrogenase alpha subunit